MRWDHRAFDGAYAAAFLHRLKEDPRDPRLGGGARSSALPRSAGSGASPTARPTPCSARCSRTAPTTTCCCSSTRTSTRSGRGPTRRTCWSPPASVGAELVHADRGGDVTYHGPGQLVGYPIVTLPEWRDGLADTVAYVRRLEQVLIDALGRPRPARRRARRDRLTGVWVGPTATRKIAAIGVKVARGPHDARLRPQRRPRPRHVRPHRAVRHPRQGGHVAGPAEGVDAADGRRSSTRSSPASPSASAADDGRAPGRGVARAAPTTSVAVQPRRGAAAAPASRCGCSAGSPPPASTSPAADPAFRRKPEWLRVKARPRRRATARLKRTMRELVARHGVRGGRLPEHLRVLGRRHGHVHDQRRAVHPGLRLLPRRHAPAAAARPRRAGACRRGGRDAWASRTPSSRASPATTSPTAARPASRRRSPPSARRDPATRVEVLIPDCKGDPAALDDDLRRPPRRAEPQPRDGRPPPAGRAARRPATPAAWPCWPGRRTAGLTTKSGLIVGHGRDDRRGARRAGRPARRRRRHRHARPVPAADGAATCRSPAGGRPTSSPSSARTARRSASPTSRRARSSGRATTPSAAAEAGDAASGAAQRPARCRRRASTCDPAPRRTRRRAGHARAVPHHRARLPGAAAPRWGHGAPVHEGIRAVLEDGPRPVPQAPRRHPRAAGAAPAHPGDGRPGRGRRRRG